MFQDTHFESPTGGANCFLAAEETVFQMPDREVIISKACPEDLPGIHALETAIEGSGAASRSALENRLQMFRNGFLVAKCDHQVAGYLQSTIWQDMVFARFSEICEFEQWHRDNGDELYLIYLAVHPAFRSNGLAGHFLTVLSQLGRVYGLNQITLVAKNHLIPFYERNGYQPVKELPDFLPGKEKSPYLMQKHLV